MYITSTASKVRLSAFSRFVTVCLQKRETIAGHEADHIILSVVRTDKPGFLGFLNRMNVMLTRCKKGMVIVTQRAFLTGVGRHTLLGKLAAHWEEQGGPGVWRDAMDVVNGRAALPGLA